MSERIGDEIVQGLTQFYELLSRMTYFPPSAIQYPPAGGWGEDELNTEILRRLKKSEALIDLLRHVPYMNRERWPVWYGDTYAVDYREETSDRPSHLPKDPITGASDYQHLLLLHEDYIEGDFSDPVTPPGFACLTIGGSASSVWIVDADTGVVYSDSCSAVSEFGIPAMNDPPKEQPWLGLKSMPAKNFFDAVCTHIAALELIPIPERDFVSGRTWRGRKLKKVYAQYGWPNTFDRDACMDAIQPTNRRLLTIELDRWDRRHRNEEILSESEDSDVARERERVNLEEAEQDADSDFSPDEDDEALEEVDDLDLSDGEDMEVDEVEKLMAEAKEDNQVRAMLERPRSCTTGADSG